MTASETRLQDGGGGRDAILVEVADDGPGIPADVREKVFDVFFTTKPQGSGLGLAIVKRIVDAHDGRLDLHTSARRARGCGSRCRSRASRTRSERTHTAVSGRAQERGSTEWDGF